MSEKMFKHTITLAQKNEVKIAMSLSDIFCVNRHKQDFYNLLKNDLDILIGNENEIDLNKEQGDKILETLSALEELDDVQNIFTNANLENIQI